MGGAAWTSRRRPPPEAGSNRGGESSERTRTRPRARARSDRRCSCSAAIYPSRSSPGGRDHRRLARTARRVRRQGRDGGPGAPRHRLETLVFLASIFCLVQAIAKTGRLQAASLNLRQLLGTDLAVAAVKLIAGIGLLSGLVANIPVVAAMLVMVKGYLVTAEVVPEAAGRSSSELARRDAPGIRRDDARRNAQRQRDVIGGPPTSWRRASAPARGNRLRSPDGWLRAAGHRVSARVPHATRAREGGHDDQVVCRRTGVSRRGSDIGRGPVPYPHDRSAHADRRSRPGGTRGCPPDPPTRPVPARRVCQRSGASGQHAPRPAGRELSTGRLV